MAKTPHDLLIGEEYTNANGEKKTSWTNVGTVFEDDKGGYSGSIKNGLALTGKFIIRERKPREQA